MDWLKVFGIIVAILLGAYNAIKAAKQDQDPLVGGLPPAPIAIYSTACYPEAR